MALVIGFFNFRKNGNFPIYCPKFGQKAPNLKTSMFQKKWEKLQEFENILETSIFQNLEKNNYRHAKNSRGNDHCFSGHKSEEYRRMLGQFGVSGDLALQQIESLSGGQKSRVAFAILCGHQVRGHYLQI